MGNQVKKSSNYCMFFFSSEIMDQNYFELSCVNISLSSLRWMVPVFRFFEYVNFERKEQKVNSTS